MQKDIQPNYYEVEAKCASCGNVIKTKSTKESISVETCSNCHPFFTGEQKTLEKGGRAERFNERYNRK
ncbi:MAG: 50S ribosomal protein L31 [Clostridia bacterium]|nr:50S ribosomal protein L31 [Clostridia bacterium]